jgi:tetratricopeptide (TPR) repeat protein
MYPEGAGRRPRRFIPQKVPMAPCAPRNRYLLPLLFLGSALLYANSLGNGFVWDDYLFTIYGDAYRNFNLRTLFLSPGNGLEYLPIRDLSYLLDRLLWGEQPFGYHLSNIVIFGLTVVVIKLFADRLTLLIDPEAHPNCVTPLVMALLFAIHPLQSEVVSWVTGRNALLGGLFFTISAWCYLLFLAAPVGKGRLLYAAALLACLLSLLSKATGIILPLLLLLCSLYDRNSPLPRNLFRTAPFMLLSGLFFVLFTKIAASSHIMGSARCTTFDCLKERIAVALQIPFFYLGKFLLPLNLSAAYDITFATPLTALPVAAAALILGLAAATAIRLRHRFPPLLFSLAGYLIMLIPVLNLFPTHPVVADRYAYLPSLPLCFLVAAGAARLWHHSRRWTIFTAMALLLPAVWLTLHQNLVWRNEKSLWEHAARVSPASSLAATNLGRIYFVEKDYDRAFPLFERVQRRDPADPHYDFFRGCLRVLNGDYPGAIVFFNQALERNGDFMEALYNLGRAYEAVHDRERAIASYRKVLDSGQPDPGNMRALAREKLQGLGAR